MTFLHILPCLGGDLVVWGWGDRPWILEDIAKQDEDLGKIPYSGGLDNV